MIELLMSKMGFNPDQIKKDVEAAQENARAVIKHFNTRMDIMEQKLDLLLKEKNGKTNELDIKQLENKPLQ